MFYASIYFFSSDMLCKMLCKSYVCDACIYIYIYIHTHMCICVATGTDVFEVVAMELQIHPLVNQLPGQRQAII